MPGMNEFELLREIRAFGPDAGGSVPVIGPFWNRTGILGVACTTPLASIIFLADHKRLSGGCDFNSLNNSSRGMVAKLVHWSLIA
jgi:hypothetical protein